MTCSEFKIAVERGLDAILDACETLSRQPTALPVPPADLNAVRAILRTFASNLMLSSDLDAAIKGPTADLPAIIAVWSLTTNLTPDVTTVAMQRAYESMSSGDSILPCMPVALYLIALADDLEVVERPEP